MSLPNVPGWVWWVFWVVIILVILALLRFNFSIGAGGIHITQGLVH